MHHSNQIFNVNGSGKETLITAIALAMQTGGHAVRAWRFDPAKGLVLSFNPETGTAFPFALDASLVAELAWGFLTSEQAAKVRCEGWDAPFTGDGSDRLGWRVYTEDWGQIDREFSAFLAIKPAHLWYGK